MAGSNQSPAQQEHERENAKRDDKDPASPGFEKKLDGENRPAE